MTVERNSMKENQDSFKNITSPRNLPEKWRIPSSSGRPSTHTQLTRSGESPGKLNLAVSTDFQKRRSSDNKLLNWI